jgi:hypothetical protein
LIGRGSGGGRAILFRWRNILRHISSVLCFSSFVFSLSSRSLGGRLVHVGRVLFHLLEVLFITVRKDGTEQSWANKILRVVGSWAFWDIFTTSSGLGIGVVLFAHDLILGLVSLGLSQEWLKEQRRNVRHFLS